MNITKCELKRLLPMNVFQVALHKSQHLLSLCAKYIAFAPLDHSLPYSISPGSCLVWTPLKDYYLWGLAGLSQ